MGTVPRFVWKWSLIIPLYQMARFVSYVNLTENTYQVATKGWKYAGLGKCKSSPWDTEE